jgi:uncharacterized protein YjbJ (UPF0337 family)
MSLNNFKGSVKVISGKVMQTIGSHTGNSDLFFSGKRKELMGEMERKYDEFRYINLKLRA